VPSAGEKKRETGAEGGRDKKRQKRQKIIKKGKGERKSLTLKSNRFFMIEYVQSFA
jgi:hypothetical protein